MDLYSQTRKKPMTPQEISLLAAQQEPEMQLPETDVRPEDADVILRQLDPENFQRAGEKLFERNLAGKRAEAEAAARAQAIPVPHATATAASVGTPPKGTIPTAENKANEKLGVARTETTPVMVSDGQQADALEGIGRAYGNVDAREIESFQRQMQGLNRLEAEKGLMNNIPVQLDVSPIAQLLDQMNGTHLAKGYKAPADANELATAQAKMEDMIQKDRSGLSKNDLAYFKSLFPSAFNQLKTTQESGAAAATGFKPPPGNGSGKPDHFYERQLNDLAGKLSPMSENQAIFMKLDALVGGIDNWKGGDIAGAGATGKLPAFLLSAKGKEIKQTRDELKNQILKMRSGGTVTINEAGRLENALGSGVWNDDKQMIDGLKNFRSEFNSIAKTRMNGVDPNVKRQFLARMGITTGDDWIPGKSTATPNEFSVPRGGKHAAPAFVPKDTSKMSLDEKKAYLEELKTHNGAQ
jgi:hypothetical protein